jgi:hypothetical protein
MSPMCVPVSIHPCSSDRYSLGLADALADDTSGRNARSRLTPPRTVSNPCSHARVIGSPFRLRRSGTTTGGSSLALALLDGLNEADGLSDALGETDGLSDALGLTDGETLDDGLGDSDTLDDGLSDADGVPNCDRPKSYTRPMPAYRSPKTSRLVSIHRPPSDAGNRASLATMTRSTMLSAPISAK